MPLRANPTLNTTTEDRLNAYRARRGRDAQATPSGKAAWTRYAAATGAAVAGAHAAEATIVHVTPPNPIGISIDTMQTSTRGTQRLDLDSNSVADIDLFLGRLPVTESSVYGGVTYNTFADSVGALGFQAPDGGGQWAVDGSFSIRALEPGASISSGMSFADSGGFRVLGESTVTTTGGFSQRYSFNFGQFPTDGTELAGIRFEKSGATHYGWIRLRLESAPGGRISVLEALEWAFEDTPGAPIAAGVIPEPTGLAMLAIGAAGVAALRSRN